MEGGCVHGMQDRIHSHEVDMSPGEFGTHGTEVQKCLHLLVQMRASPGKHHMQRP